MKYRGDAVAAELSGRDELVSRLLAYSVCDRDEPSFSQPVFPDENNVPQTRDLFDDATDSRPNLRIGSRTRTYQDFRAFTP
jgi:hypothetical protein